MTFEEIQARVNTLSDQLAESGKLMPTASLEIKANADCIAMLRWAQAGETFPDQFHFARAATPEAALEKAVAWIAELPSPRETAIAHALTLSAKALEAARAADLDTDGALGANFVARLEDMVKRISSNALTDRSGS